MAPKRGNKKASGGAAKKVHTPEMLIEQGNVALGNMELELAAEFFTRALALSRDDTNIMDALADVKMQIGDTDKALELLLTSTVMAPTVNPYKWLFLGQLQVEFEAVNSYRTGIKILSELLSAESDADSKALIAKQTAKAHCSITEIYLTDLCFEEDAERVCEAELAAAMNVCPASLDAQQTLASVRLSQNRKGDAGDIMTAVCNQVMRIRQVVAARTVMQEMSGAEEPTEFQDLPEMSFCIATLKLLIECASDPRHSALYVRAQELGSGLLEEDDENIELWYLMGVACMGGADACTARPSTSTSTSVSAEMRDNKKPTNNSKKSKAKTGVVASAAPVDECEGTDLAAAQFHFETAAEMMDRLRQQIAEEQEQEGGMSGDVGGEGDCGFPYQEQYELVQEHLRIIAAISGGVSLESSAVAGAGGAQPMDEEWSDDEGNGSGSMAVDH